MTFAVTIRLSAKVDIAEAEDWYDRDHPGRGIRFRAAVYDTIDRIANNPLAYPDLLLGNHRAVTHKFPYSVWFRVAGHKVLIVAVIHGRRNRRFVRTRIGGV